MSRLQAKTSKKPLYYSWDRKITAIIRNSAQMLLLQQFLGLYNKYKLYLYEYIYIY